MNTCLLKRLKRKANKYVRVEEYKDELIIVDTRHTTNIEKKWWNFVNKFFSKPGFCYERRVYQYSRMRKRYEFESNWCHEIDLATLYPHQRIDMVIQAKRDFIVNEVMDMRLLIDVMKNSKRDKIAKRERKHDMKFLNSVKI